jgi:hypothetical protein
MREARAMQKQHAENGISEAWQRQKEILGCRLEEAAMESLPNLSVCTLELMSIGISIICKGQRSVR